MTGGLHSYLAPAFVLDKALVLDPTLRAAADKIGAEHVARIDKLFPVWLSEEASRQAVNKIPPTSPWIFYAVLARLLNELSLWQLEPGDATYENATLAALRTSTRLCEISGDFRYTDFASRILRIQAMPVAQRDAALDGERRLLAHWGQPRAALAPWPDPLPQDAALALLARGPADAANPRLALSPELASVVFGQQQDYAHMHPVSRCMLQQWWLRQNLHRGMAPAAALSAFRYGTMLSAVDRLGTAYDKPGADDKPGPGVKPPYPGIAMRFQVTGDTTARVQAGVDGKQKASMVERRIEVEGIRGVRPVAFENVFDKAMLAFAETNTGRYAKPADSTPQQIKYLWRLEDPKPAAKPGDKR